MYFEAKGEEQALTPEQDASLKQIVVQRAPAALAELEAAKNDYDLFVALPNAAYAAFHLEKFDLAACGWRNRSQAAVGVWNRPRQCCRHA
jgi:hypothetical protein